MGKPPFSAMPLTDAPSSKPWPRLAPRPTGRSMLIVCGDEDFRQELLAQMGGKRGVAHFGRAPQESEAAQAERVVKSELERLGWGEKDSSGRRKGDSQKVRLAGFLRQKTTLTIGSIAERLRMG